MKEKFAPAQISQVIDQALVYQCACPAQVCRAIFELRDLYSYQMSCATDEGNDQDVHRIIAAATATAHAAMEDCLTRVLELEGWDMETLLMPQALKAKTLKTL